MDVDASADRRPSALAQWSAIVATVLVSLVLAVVLPRVAANSRPPGTALPSGTPVEFDGVSIVPSEGWTETDNPAALILEKGDIKLVLLPPAADATSASDSVAASLKAWTEDPASEADIGTVETLTTDAGLDAAYVAVTEGDSVFVIGAFSDGSSLATADIQLTASQWADAQEEIAAMVGSVSFTEESPS